MKRSETDPVVPRRHRVRGGAGVELHVQETGDPAGRPILFLHGLSQCRLAWDRQLSSSLSQHLRLVALDLRGHGDSEQPHDDYGEPFLWADDVAAVITDLHLNKPILCGWSYGGVVIGDYLRCHGERDIAGVHLVSAVSRLGEPVMPFLGSEFLETLPGLFSDDVEASTFALRRFVRSMTSQYLAPEDFYRMLGYNSVVPPHVRQAMLNRTVVYDNVLERLTTPVLITHGLEDAVVTAAMSQHHERLIPHAKASYYPNVGHTPFWEQPERFNAELQAFAASL